jgi:hypothetical protein
MRHGLPSRASSKVELDVAAAVLLVAAALAIDGLWRSFKSPYLIQDDARHFVVFIRHFHGSGLFENDLIADYFLSTLPMGFRAVHGAALAVGIDPVVLNKLLPLPLTLVLGWYAARLGRHLTGSAAGAFFVGMVVLLLQASSSGTSSGVPRAFAMPLLTAGLLYLLEGRRIPLALVMVLLAAFYPQATILLLGIVGLSIFQRRDGTYHWRPDLGRVRTVIPAMVLGVACLGIFALQVNGFGPATPLGAARSYPVFNPGGHVAFFEPDLAYFYLCHHRAGLLPVGNLCKAVAGVGEWAEVLVVAAVAAGLVLMVVGLVAWSRSDSPSRPRRAISILFAVLLAGLVLFGLAHAVLFKLHLPSRYSHAAAGLVGQIGFGVLVTCLWTWGRQRAGLRPWAPWQRGAVAAAAAVVFSLLAWEAPGYPDMALVRGKKAGLYEALRELPQQGLVATMFDGGSLIPAFANRSVVTAAEFEVPYSQGYYEQIHARTKRLIEAFYSPDPAVLQRFVQDLGVTAFVIEDPWASPDDLADRSWLREYRTDLLRADAVAKGTDGPILRHVASCGRSVDELVVIPVSCLPAPGAAIATASPKLD